MLAWAASTKNWSLTVRKTRSILPRPSGRPGREWMSRMPRLAQALSNWAETNGLPLSKLWRHRHNLDYADPAIMPTFGSKPCSAGVEGAKLSA